MVSNNEDGDLKSSLTSCLVLIVVASAGSHATAQSLIPGSGIKVLQVGDDFEDPEWTYNFNGPKSTRNLDKATREPTGLSRNDRWYEGAKRGHPDVIRRVATPAGGIKGSKGSLLLRSLRTGIPGRPSYRMQQDDFIADVNYRLGGKIPVSQSPSAVVRVFLPPVKQWEQRTGPHFAFRVAITTTAQKRGLLGSSRNKNETYWPGMFVEFQSKADGDAANDYAWIRVRANRSGGDFKGKQITITGWWTFGISCTADGRIHYYASPGVDDLTAEDHLTSQFPYGYRAEHFKTFFFNVCNGDDGRTWSTAWVIDDPSLFFVRAEKTASRLSPVR